MADSKTELANLTKNLGRANKAIVASAENLGTESQKMIAKQIGEQRKDFSSFLAGRKLQAAIRKTDTTALQQAKLNLDKTKAAQETALAQDKTLMKLQDQASKTQLELESDKNNSHETNMKLQKKQSVTLAKISERESEVRKQLNTKLEKDTEVFDKLSKEYNEKIENAGKSEGFEKFTAGLKTLTGGLVDIAPIFDDIVKYVNAFKDVFTGTFSLLGSVSESFLGYAMLKGVTPDELFKDGIGGIFKDLFKGLKNILKFVFITPFVKLFQLGKFLMTKTVSIVKGFISAFQSFGLIPTGVLDYLKGLFISLKTKFFGWVSTMASSFVSMTRNFLTIHLPAFYTWLTTQAANLYSMASQTAVFKGGIKALKTLGGYIKWVFMFMGNLIKNFILVPIRAAVVSIGTAISTAFAAAVAYIGAIPLAIAAAVIGLVILAYIFKDYLEIKWGEFKTWFGNSMDRLSELANSLGDWISEKWDTYVTQPIQKFITMIGNLVNMITDKIGEYKSNIGILSKEARTEVDKARESGLYDEDAVGNSELKQDMVADAPTQQLQAILEDNDLSDENKKFVQQELDSRNEGYYLGAMPKIDSSDSMSNSGDDIADGTLNASNAANLIVTNIQQNSNQSNSNGTVVVSGNPTVVDVDPSAGKGNNMGWGSFAGQGGYN